MQWVNAPKVNVKVTCPGRLLIVSAYRYASDDDFCFWTISWVSRHQLS